MLKKKQVVTIVSIAVMSFLIGTTFNVMTMATDGGNPWDRVWTAISELQSSVNSLNASLVEFQGRMNSIEEKLNQTKTIRFVDPMEHVQNESIWKDIANFTWLASDETNNAILSAAFYFEYKHKPPEPSQSTIANLKIYVEYPVGGIEIYNVVHHFLTEDYKWSPVYVLPNPTRSPLVKPNQASYNIKVQLDVSQGTAYFRNINVILTVVDGMSASNP